MQSTTAENDVVDFRVSPKEYHPDYIQAVWRLIDLRVALDKIPEVFDVVLSLVGKKVAQHPCRPSLMKMSGSRLPASQLQIHEVFSNIMFCTQFERIKSRAKAKRLKMRMI